MNPDAGGLNQTLYNVLSFLDPENFLCVTLDNAIKYVPPSEPFTNRYITYHFEIIPVTRNRFSKYFNPLIDWFNFSYNEKFRKFKKIRKRVAEFKPDIVISCPNGVIGLFMHHKIVENMNFNKVIPYFMDDWVSQSKLTWLGGNIHQSVKGLLNNKSWLMISEELAIIFQERYKIIPQHLLIVHNPVDLSDAPAKIPLTNKQNYIFAYAGSLWDMHYDSFYALSKGIAQLNNTFTIKSICYTAPYFWELRKDELEKAGVVFGGRIAYKDIHQVLSQADILLLSSSFSEEWITHSKSSVQTKITDYLKAGRLIVSCGPAYSANHAFIKKHNCGVCIETTDPIAIKEEIKKILENFEDYQHLVDNGWHLLEKDFAFDKVHKKLIDFLN